MAIIRPFKGLRPPKDLVEQVQSRPYDVLDSEEARAEAEGNEKSLYHIIKPDMHAEYTEALAGRYFATPKKMGAQTAEANVNAGIAAAKQSVGYLKDGITKFQLNK